MMVLLNQQVATLFEVSIAAAGVIAKSKGKLKVNLSKSVSPSTTVIEILRNCGTKGLDWDDILYCAVGADAVWVMIQENVAAAPNPEAL